MEINFEDRCKVVSLAYDIKYKAGCLMMRQGIESFGKNYGAFLDTICDASGKAFIEGLTERQKKFYFIKAQAQFNQLPYEVKECYIQAAKELQLDMANLIEACI